MHLLFCKAVRLTMLLVLLPAFYGFCQLTNPIPAPVIHLPEKITYNDSTIIDAMRKEARKNSDSGNFTMAISIYMEIIKKAKIPAQRSLAYGDLSAVYENLGEFNLAIDTYLKAIDLTSDTVRITKLKVNISNVYLELRDYESAFTNLDQAARFFTERKDTLWLAIISGVRANIFKQQMRSKEALEQEFIAYNLIKTMCVTRDCVSEELAATIIRFRSTILNNIADAFLILGEPDSALYYLGKTAPDYPHLPQLVKAVILVTTGEVYAKKNNLAKAVEYFKAGEVIAEKSQMYAVKRAIYKELAHLYAQKGDYNNAYQYQQKYIQNNDIIKSRENIHKINHIQNKYALEKKDNEIAHKELQISQQQLRLVKSGNQRSLFIALSIAIVVIAALIIRSQKNRQKYLKQSLTASEREKELAKTESSLKGQELERERIAKELHDSVVSELLVLNMNLKTVGYESTGTEDGAKMEKIISQAEEIAQRLRKVSHNLMPAHLKELGLTGSINSFIEKIDSRYCNFTFQTYGTIKAIGESTERIVMMIVQELVQNIIKHANATAAIIQMDYYQEVLSLTVEDNGISFNPENRPCGIGINNIKQNVAILGGTFDLRSSQYKGTTVLIEIPINDQI